MSKLDTHFQSIGLCIILSVKFSSYVKSFLDDNKAQSHVIWGLSIVEITDSLSNSISFLPLSATQSQFDISKDKRSDKEIFNAGFDERHPQSQFLCLVFSNNSLSIISLWDWDSWRQSQSLSWFLIKNSLLTDNFSDEEIDFQSHASELNSFSKESSKVISFLLESIPKSNTSLNCLMFLDKFDWFFAPE